MAKSGEDRLTNTLVLGWLPQPLGGIALIQQSFFDSIWQFAHVDGSPDGRRLLMGYVAAQSGYIAQGRDEVVKTFLRTEADWLLMLDWDITFKPEDVYALIDEAAGDWSRIIGGCYVTWFGTDNALRPCWMSLRPDGQVEPVTEFDTQAVVPLGVVGMGFTLIHRKALQVMFDGANDDPWAWFAHDVIGASHAGEDVTFCERARRCGLTVWGHGGVQVGHTKLKTLVPADMFNPALAFAHQSVDKTVLNVGGCSKNIPLPDTYRGWRHVLLDIEPGPDVDVVLDARKLMDLGAGYEYDAIYCSHALEHFEPEDVPTVLAGMEYVLRCGGTVEIRVPDGDAIDDLVEMVGLHGVAYESPSGPITPYDMIHGHQASVAAGQTHMAHHIVFTARSLRAALRAAGFTGVKVGREPQSYELVATARRRSRA